MKTGDAIVFVIDDDESVREAIRSFCTGLAGAQFGDDDVSVCRRSDPTVGAMIVSGSGARRGSSVVLSQR